ncbi:aprataxin and PNK-like factor isoform X1 [Pieris brassicae]|uniref:aprataxin and PNK-like factor isoform X1 n=2 Tax=Pieris brassicae TaxID=7116 RepID=UPI001E661D27|nr:aprataxin and PNK-like factor isoform X1 [Pieris brassicae]
MVTKMPVKLIRTDVDTLKKIALSPGSHIIGRGEHLEVFDKRVSRKHAKIEVKNDSIVVNALHHNPVFYTKRGSSKSEALTLNSVVVLSNGDKIGLLPRTYWFEIIVVDENNSSEQTNNIEVNENEDLTTTSEETLSIRASHDDNIQQPETFQEPNTEQLDNTQEPKLTDSPTKRRRSASEDTLNFDSVSENSESDSAKKIKLEPPDSNYGNSQQGISDANTASSSSVHQGNPSSGVRERCYYGARCYRRNPVHLVQYSHPRDSDWGTSDRGVCPNGAYCTKNDPRHWDTHTHPPGTTRLPQLQGKPKTKKKKKQIEDTTDESDQDLNGLNMRACRRNRGGSVSDFDLDCTGSESDPYGSDESDEWHPLDGKLM